MLLYAVSLLVVAQTSSEVPEGLMNYPVLCNVLHYERLDTVVQYCILLVDHDAKTSSDTDAACVATA